MVLRVERAVTVNEAGEPVRTFRGGDRIAFHLYYTASDIPAKTRVAARFYITHLQNFTVFGGANLTAFQPIHAWEFEGLIEPGSWLSWTTWRLPDTEPLFGVPLDEWNRILLSEHDRMSSWGGVWELTGMIMQVEPPREGEFDHNRERWLYSIEY